MIRCFVRCLLILSICVSPAAAGRGRVVHLPGHPAADALGYVLVSEAGDADLRSERENPPDMPGWPLHFTQQGIEEGVVLIQADSDPELEVLFQTNRTVRLHDTDGTSLAGWPLTVPVGTRCSGGPAAGDLDGDGTLEIVVSADNWPNGSSGWVYAYRLDGTVVPGFPATTNGDFCKSPTVVDLDGDGAAEIIVGERDYPSGKVYVIGGDGAVLPGWPVQLNHVPAASAGAADLDADGVLEVVYESYSSVYAWHLDGSLVEGFPFTPSGGETFSYSAPVFADVDGDDLPEIAVGLHFGSNGVLLLDGDGSLLPGWPQSTYYWVYGPPTFADLDGDGDLEILVGDQVLSPSPTDYVYAWHHDGSPVAGWPVGPLNAINAQVAAADIDGDGDPELIWDDNTSEGLLLGYHHTGAPISGWPLTVEGTTFFNTVAIGDVDLDGDLELAAASNGMQESYSNVYLWDLAPPASTADIQMPMFQYGPGRDGRLRVGGSGPTPTPTPTSGAPSPSPTAALTATPTSTPSPPPSPTATTTPTWTAVPSSTPFPSPTPAPSLTPTPTRTPTPAPPTATPSPVSTATPAATALPCLEFELTLVMPSTHFTPGDPCWLDLEACNPDGDVFECNLVALLDVFGEYFFWPGWTRQFEYREEWFEPGVQALSLIPEFVWPEGVGSGGPFRFYASCLDETFTALRCNLAVFEFSYGPGP
jgi:hypothetical protein